MLTRPADSITLAEVWCLVQAGDPVLGLHGPNPSCPVGIDVQRALVVIERQVADAVETRLGTITIADVLSDAAKSAVDSQAAPHGN